MEVSGLPGISDRRPEGPGARVTTEGLRLYAALESLGGAAPSLFPSTFPSLAGDAVSLHGWPSESVGPAACICSVWSLEELQIL